MLQEAYNDEFFPRGPRAWGSPGAQHIWWLCSPWLFRVASSSTKQKLLRFDKVRFSSCSAHLESNKFSSQVRAYGCYDKAFPQTTNACQHSSIILCPVAPI